ncbi:MAG: ATP-binding cassette domain-containing protein [Saprospiraceae bacterium]|nr:ATP-binding cassette domain-containing protein [Saprospiraceae bacterium]
MIQVNEMSFGYRKKKAPLFQNLNLQLEPGTINGILGKNGAGKTTFLRVVSVCCSLSMVRPW